VDNLILQFNVQMSVYKNKKGLLSYEKLPSIQQLTFIYS